MDSKWLVDPDPIPVDMPIGEILADIDRIFEHYDTPEKTSFGLHEKFKYSVKGLAKKYGMKGVDEYEVDNRGDNRRGFIDIVWVDSDNTPIVAIEIDNQFRKKSLFKLRHVGARLKIQIFMQEVEYDPTAFHDVIIIPKRRCGKYSKYDLSGDDIP
jgi:hypothetical protein